MVIDRPTVTRALMDGLFGTAAIQRWTDHVRPLDLTVLGKHAHMMAIAWVLGHAQHDNGDELDWDYLIAVSFLELMRKSVLTDMKSQVLERFRNQGNVGQQLDRMALEVLRPALDGMGRDWAELYEAHFLGQGHLETAERHLAWRVLRAASAIATEWEFRILEHANPVVADLQETRRNIDADVRKYQYLPGVRQIVNRENDLASFVDIIGRLRFQLRWAQTPICPTRPVLDHELLVAYVAFLAADCLHCEDIGKYDDVLAVGYHAFFGALFHDLPEVLTRDIISPVKKKTPALAEELSALEREWFDSTFRPMLPRHWFQELHFMSINEFEDKNWPPAGLKIDLIPRLPSCLDGFHPGQLIRACDNLCAFIEAHSSIMYGVESNWLWQALTAIYGVRDELSKCGPDFATLFVDYAGQLKGRAERSPWGEAAAFAQALVPNE